MVLLDNGFRQPLPDSLTEPATILADMDAAGVDVVAASIAPPMSHLDVDPKLGLAVSRAINDAFAELADGYRGRVLPLGNVPLQDVDRRSGSFGGSPMNTGSRVCRSAATSAAKISETKRTSRSGKRCANVICSVLSRGEPVGRRTTLRAPAAQLRRVTDRYRGVGRVDGVQRCVRTASGPEDLLLARRRRVSVPSRPVGSRIP